MPTTKTPSGNAQSDDDALSATRLFKLLSNHRRRRAVQYLSRQVAAVTIGDLADHIALQEGSHTRDRYERVCTSLVHIHLPALADAGIVRYDLEQETVEPRKSITQLTPHLDLAASTENQ